MKLSYLLVYSSPLYIIIKLSSATNATIRTEDGRILHNYYNPAKYLYAHRYTNHLHDRVRNSEIFNSSGKYFTGSKKKKKSYTRLVSNVSFPSEGMFVNYYTAV